MYSHREIITSDSDSFVGKGINIFIVFLLVLVPLSGSMANKNIQVDEIEQSKDVIRSLIEVFKSTQYDYGGIGTARIKVGPTGDFFGDKTEERMIQFKFKDNLSRSDYHYLNEEKEKEFVCTWSIHRKGALGYTGGLLTLRKKPRAQFERQFGFDFHPETFSKLCGFRMDAATLLERLLTADKITTNLDDKGILHISFFRESANGGYKFSFDTTKGYRVVSWEIDKDVRIREQTRRQKGSYKAEWANYDGEGWYVKKALYKINNKTIEVEITDFRFNPNIPDSEFTADGLNIPIRTDVFDQVLGINYQYGEPAIKKHLVPGEKKLSKKDVRSLYKRGERTVYRGKELDTIGMPVGGIATGQLYLRGDGTLGLWQIFNKHIFTGSGATCYRTYRPDSPVDSGFAVIVEQNGKMFGKPLNRDFGTVEFIGVYPIGIVRYRNDGFPVKVALSAYSPFIPLNAKDSALPATLFNIVVENTSDTNLRVGILGWLENAVLIDSAKAVHALRRSRVINDIGQCLIVHTAEEAPIPKGTAEPQPNIVLADFEGPNYGDWKITGQAFGKGPANGTLTGQQKVSGFLGRRLVNTFLGGDRPYGTLTSPSFKISRKFINFLVGGGSHVGRTCINLLVDGKVVLTATGKNNEKLEWYFWNVQEFEDKAAQIEIVDKFSGGWGHINVDQIEISDKPRKGPIGPIDKLPDYGSMVLALAENGTSPNDVRRLLTGIGDWAAKLHAEDNVAYPVSESRSAALATHNVELAPGAKRLYSFVLSWFFPNHQNGREYANRFNSASEVAGYVLDDYERLAGDTANWYKTYYEHSTLPRWLLFRLHSTVCNVATGTCQWWKNGRFWAWEGVGCCAGTCTHVWNYSHAPARLFPELERSAREMQDFGEGFDSESGLVGFRSNRAYAADGQCGSVLKAYREHQASADYSFLKRNWPNIKKALEFSIKQDGNDDGLIENSQHNTYDINFEGPNTFVGSLYLAALRAGEEMAKEMGDEQFAIRCRKIFESGSRLSVERLWDGEYFIQLVDLKKHPKHQYAKGCLSDQLFGQGWAHQLGLNYIYPPQYVKKALQSVWKYNWTPDIGPYNAAYKPERWFARPGEAGLFTCTWPKSPYLAAGVRYKSEVWTGIEYQVAGNMVWEGMVDEALAICRGIHERYHPAKHNPFNEVECGDHYARAMASWGVYTALSGYEYHGPKGHLGFAPRLTPENFRAAFTAAEGWGTFAQKRDRKTQREQIELRWGQLSLKSLAFTVPEDFRSINVSVTAAGQPIEIDYKLKDGRLEITLTKKLAIFENQTLDITINRLDE